MLFIVFPDKSSPQQKSIGFAFIILAVAVVGVVMLQVTDKTGPIEDIRSHAANPADRVIDSDALLNDSEQSFNAVNNDPELNNTLPSTNEDDEIKAINAL